MQSVALLCYAGSGELTFMFVTFMFVAVSAASALLLCCATVFVQCSGSLLPALLFRHCLCSAVAPYSAALLFHHCL